jgi:hypothetical protein
MSQSVKMHFKAHSGGNCDTWQLRQWLIWEMLAVFWNSEEGALEEDNPLQLWAQELGNLREIPGSMHDQSVISKMRAIAFAL